MFMRFTDLFEFFSFLFHPFYIDNSYLFVGTLTYRSKPYIYVLVRPYVLQSANSKRKTKYSFVIFVTHYSFSTVRWVVGYLFINSLFLYTLLVIHENMNDLDWNIVKSSLSRLWVVEYTTYVTSVLWYCSIILMSDEYTALIFVHSNMYL